MKKLVVAVFLGILLLVGCSGNDDEVDLTPNVSFSGDEADLEALDAVLSGSNKFITIPYDPIINPQPGQGYLSMIDDFMLRTCFEAEMEQDPFTSKQVVGNYNFDMAESMQDLLTKLQLNTSVSVGFGLFSADASFSFLKNTHISTHTVVAVATYDILGTSQSVKGNLTSNFPSGFSPENAYSICGDYYVYSIREGAKLYAVITIETSSTEEKNNIESSLEASYGGFAGGKVDFKKEFQETLENYHAKINVVGIGCKPVSPITSWEGYLAALDTFYDDEVACLAKHDPQNSPVTVTLAPAYELYPTDSKPEKLDVQRDAMKKLINFDIEYEQLLADLEHFETYIATYDLQSLYASRDAALAQIYVTKDKINTELIEKINARIQECQIDPYNCEFLSELDLPESDEPDNLRDAVIPDISFYPETCDDLLDNGDGYLSEGEYTLYFHGLERFPFQAYCKNMDPGLTSDPPKTYLTLLDSDDNYAQFKHLWKYVHKWDWDKARWKPNITWPDLKTSYGKVRLDVEQDAVYIDVLDNTFANNPVKSTIYPFFCKDLGTPESVAFKYVPYGTGFRSNWGSKYPSEPSDPVTVIDLSGTKFKIAEKEEWIVGGHEPAWYSGETRGSNGQTVSLQVMGNNGLICPSNYPRIKLEYCPECEEY